MIRIRTLMATVVAASIAFGACSTDAVAPPVGDPVDPVDTVEAPPPPTAPGPEAPDPDPSESGSQVSVLERSSALAEDEVVTKVIGPLGGVIVLPEAGLSVVFPPLAVAEPTEITITAPAGNLVGYYFAPHGLEFAVPVVATQDLSTTLSEGLDGLRAVYFEGELEPSVTLLEELPLEILGILGTFDIHHFSGYVIATN